MFVTHGKKIPRPLRSAAPGAVLARQSGFLRFSAWPSLAREILVLLRASLGLPCCETHCAFPGARTLRLHPRAQEARGVGRAVLAGSGSSRATRAWAVGLPSGSSGVAPVRFLVPAPCGSIRFRMLAPCGRPGQSSPSHVPAARRGNPEVHRRHLIRLGASPALCRSGGRPVLCVSGDGHNSFRFSYAHARASSRGWKGPDAGVRRIERHDACYDRVTQWDRSEGMARIIVHGTKRMHGVIHGAPRLRRNAQRD